MLSAGQTRGFSDRGGARSADERRGHGSLALRTPPRGSDGHERRRGILRPGEPLLCIGRPSRPRCCHLTASLPGPVIALLRQLLLLCWLAALVGGGAQAQPTAIAMPHPPWWSGRSRTGRARGEHLGALLQRHSSEGAGPAGVAAGLGASRSCRAMVASAAARCARPGANSPGAGPDQVELRWYRTHRPPARMRPWRCMDRALSASRFRCWPAGRVSSGASCCTISLRSATAALPLWVPLPTAGETGRSCWRSPWRPRLVCRYLACGWPQRMNCCPNGSSATGCSTRRPRPSA